MSAILIKDARIIPAYFSGGIVPYNEEWKALERSYVGYVLIEDGYIRSTGPGHFPGLWPGTVIDGRGALVAPGIIEGQCNGFMGIDFSDPALATGAVADSALHILRWGVGRLFPTIITNTSENMLSCLHALNKAEEYYSAFHFLCKGCRHIEGPYLDVPGAHNPDQLRDPDINEYRAWRDVVQGKLLVTLSPTRKGALAFVMEASRNKETVIAMSHTSPKVNPRDSENQLEILESVVAAGCKLAVHIANAYPESYFEKYTFGYPGFVMAHDDLYATVIADGHHLSPWVIKSILRAKGLQKSILWTDMMMATGMPQYAKYQLAGREIEVTDAAWLDKEKYQLAGSILTPLQQITNAAAWCGLGWDQVWPMLSCNPAHALGLNQLGSIKPDYEATLLLFESEWSGEWEQMKLIGNMIDGVWMYDTPKLKKRTIKPQS